MVRAKFFVTEVKHHHQPAGQVFATVVLAPVYGDSDENKTWSKWTPQGKIEMGITNPDAIEQFALGKPYYIDFTPAD